MVWLGQAEVPSLLTKILSPPEAVALELVVRSSLVAAEEEGLEKEGGTKEEVLEEEEGTKEEVLDEV